MQLVLTAFILFGLLRYASTITFTMEISNIKALHESAHTRYIKIEEEYAWLVQDVPKRKKKLYFICQLLKNSK